MLRREQQQNQRSLGPWDPETLTAHLRTWEISFCAIKAPSVWAFSEPNPNWYILSGLIYIEIMSDHLKLKISQNHNLNSGSLWLLAKEFKLYPVGSREQKISEPDDQNCALEKSLWQQVGGQFRGTKER